MAMALANKIQGIELLALHSDGGANYFSVGRGLLYGSAEARLTFARLAATHPVAIGGKSELDAAALLTSEQRGGSLSCRAGGR